MSKDLGKVLGILASIAAIIGTCVAIIALIPAFGQWIATINDTPSTVEVLPTSTNAIETTIPPTLTVLPSTTSTIPSTDLPSFTPTPEEIASNILFVDKFDDNSNGWVFNENTRLSSGKLATTVKRGDWLWLTLPNFKVDGDFYIQAEMLLSEGHGCFSAMGFAVGEADISQHSFLFSSFGCNGGRVGLYENTVEIFSTKLDDISLNKNVSYILGLELKNGLYTFYVNGDPTDSTTLTVSGNDIGIFLWRATTEFSPSTSTYFIDNVVLKTER